MKKPFSRDVLLISFSAFFADLGYQGVTALFPLFLVLRHHAPVYVYGIVTAVAFGVGSFFAFIGGKAGDRFDRKTVAILGNLFIPLMSLSGLFGSVWLCGVLFVLGWWARYFRTPARRALLVEAAPSDLRSKAFGFLHALDIGGGLLSALFALLFISYLRMPIGRVILFSAIPLFISSALLFFIKRTELYPVEDAPANQSSAEQTAARSRKRTLFSALLISATFYGFSFYNAGYPVLTAATAQNAGYAPGLIAYLVYMGISAVSGYALGSRRFRSIHALWKLGYLPSAIASLLIGANIALHLPGLSFYIFVAGLGLGMGAVETFEPTAVSSLVQSRSLSGGMGWLSVSRSLGQFISNLVMGIIFSFSQSLAYGYAFIASLAATAVLASAERRANKAEPAPRPRQG